MLRVLLLLVLLVLVLALVLLLVSMMSSVPSLDGRAQIAPGVRRGRASETAAAKAAAAATSSAVIICRLVDQQRAAKKTLREEPHLDRGHPRWRLRVPQQRAALVEELRGGVVLTAQRGSEVGRGDGERCGGARDRVEEW